MNITRLFLEANSSATLTHLRSAESQVTRTWRELRSHVAGICRTLRRRNVRAGERVLILSSSRIEVIESLLAIFNVGAVAMPVSPLLGAASIQMIIRRMLPRLCLFEEPLDPQIGAALDEVSCGRLDISAIDNRFAAGSDEGGNDSGSGPEFPSFPDEHSALMIHGSGSTGIPKVVSMSHGALLRYFEYHDLVWRQYSDGPDRLTATGAMVTGLPLHHLGGISLCLQGLLNGRHTYLMSFFVPGAYLRLLERTRCPCILLVPSLYRSLLKDPYLRRMDRSALRFCVVGGEGCPEELLKRIEEGFGVPAVTAYSMTECLSGIGHSRVELFDGSVKRGSCGKQLFGELTLRDSQGRIAETFGELWVRNATVHRCYLDPELEQSRFHDGWFKSGDIFHRDTEGNFFYRGRVDDMFVCNGKNMYPLDIELVLLQHPDVESACAVPINCDRKGPIPAALIVCSRPLTGAAVQEFYLRNGPTHAVPQLVKFVDSLPTLGPGKVDRRSVTALLQKAYDEEHRYAAH